MCHSKLFMPFAITVWLSIALGWLPALLRVHYVANTTSLQNSPSKQGKRVSAMLMGFQGGSPVACQLHAFTHIKTWIALLFFHLVIRPHYPIKVSYPCPLSLSLSLPSLSFSLIIIEQLRSSYQYNRIEGNLRCVHVVSMLCDRVCYNVTGICFWKGALV